MSDTTIRRMQSSDLSSVVQLEQRSFPYPWSENNFRDSLEADDECWVMEVDQMIVAHGVMTLVCDDATLLNVAVCPRFQGKGIGYQLLCFLLDVVTRRGARNCFLEVRPSNNRAIGLYQKLGFEVVGRRKDYYPSDGAREDALVMQLEINHANSRN